MPAAPERVHYDKFNIVIVPAGFQNLRSYPIINNTVIRFEITVAARQLDGANRAMFRRVGLFYRQIGGPVQIQGTHWQTPETEKSSLGFGIKYLLGSSALVIQVKNAGNVATRWTGFVDLITVK